MAKTDNLIDFLEDIADGIREKKGTTDPINAQDFRSEIDSIKTDGMRYFDCRNISSDGFVYSNDTGLADYAFIAKCFFNSEIFIAPTGNYTLAIGFDPDTQCYRSDAPEMTMGEAVDELLNYYFSCTLEDLPEITKEEFYDLTWEVPALPVD